VSQLQLTEVAVMITITITITMNALKVQNTRSVSVVMMLETNIPNLNITEVKYKHNNKTYNLRNAH